MVVNTHLQKVVGWSAIGLGMITLVCSVITLVRMCRRKSVRFLRVLTLIVIFTSLIELMDGAILLQIITLVYKVKDLRSTLYLVLLSFSNFFYNIGMFSIIWFVSFKYWETSRQFSRIVRMMNLQTDHPSKQN